MTVGEAVAVGVVVDRVGLELGVTLGRVVAVVLEVAVGLTLGRAVVVVAVVVGWTDGERVGRGQRLNRGCGTVCLGRGWYE